jgi:diguanylate cyclase (GGDEF)-like protein
MEESKFLALVSNKSLDIAHDLTITTPCVYEEIFNKTFNDLNVYGFEKKIANDYYSNFTNKIDIQTKTLSTNIDRASSAIDANDKEMLNQIKNEVETLRAELKSVRDELFTDPLTNIHNRKWLSEVLTQDGVFIRNGVLAFIDLNDFKYINDNFGHNIGDKVLAVTAKLLNDIGDVDVIRYAGDEFIVFSDKLRLPELEQKLEKVYNFLQDKKLNTRQIGNGEIVVKIKFSFGITNVKNGDDRKTKIEEADRLMYDDKMRRKEDVQIVK